MFRPIRDTLKSNPELYKKMQESFQTQVRQCLSHRKVKEFVAKAHISENQLLHSLADVRHWLLESEHCEQCPGLERCPNMYKGHLPSPAYVDGKLYFDYTPCHHYLKFVQEEKQRRLLRSHLVSNQALKVQFEDLEIDEGNKQAIKAAMLFCNRFDQLGGKGLYYYGEFGVGKTYIMGAIATELTHKGKTVYFVHVPTFFREMKQSLADHTFTEKIRELEEVDCLILDDIGAEGISPWLRDEVLGPLVQIRAQLEKPILYTSNLDYDQLYIHLAESNRGELDEMKSLRIMERIRSYTEAYFLYGKNRRRTKGEA